jgi:DNA-binding transcriptional ArsR family regulator
VRAGAAFVPFVKLAHSAANFLTNSAFDPASKNPEYKACAVRVEAYQRSTLAVDRPVRQVVSEAARVAGIPGAHIYQAAEWIAAPKADGSRRCTLFHYEKGLIWGLKLRSASGVLLARLGRDRHSRSTWRMAQRLHHGSHRRSAARVGSVADARTMVPRVMMLVNGGRAGGAARQRRRSQERVDTAQPPLICCLRHLDMRKAAYGARFLRLLGDNTRLRILALLARTPDLCVCELVAILRLPQYQISRHLGQLRRAGLLAAERRGPFVFYAVAESLRRDPVRGAVLRALPKLAPEADRSSDLGRMRRLMKLETEQRVRVCATGGPAAVRRRPILRALSPGA